MASGGDLGQVLRRHNVVGFFVGAFLLSWTADIVTLTAWHPPPGSLGDALRVVVPAIIGAPAWIALAITAVTDGRTGVRRLVARCLRWRINPGWYLLVLIAVPALILLCLTIVPGAIVGTREPPLQLVASYIPAVVVILFVGGPLEEEPGWRGFALPHLQQRFSPIAASLLLGALWGLWHLPLFLLIPGYNGAGAGLAGALEPFLAFVGGTIALAILITWVFNRTRGSVLMTALLHASTNTASGAFLPSPVGFITLYALYAALAVIVLAVTRGRLGRKAAQNEA